VPKLILLPCLLVCGGGRIDSIVAAAFTAGGSGTTIFPGSVGVAPSASSSTRTIARRKRTIPRRIKAATATTTTRSTILLSAVSLSTDQDVVSSSLDLWSGLQDQFLNVVVGPIGSVLPEDIKEYDLLLAGALLLTTTAATLWNALVPPESLLSDSTRAKIVAGTFLGGGKDLERVYKASRDGWSALAFHEAVDGAGSGLVVVRGRNGKVFGGYNPSGWRSTDDYSISSAAFLWCLSGPSMSVIKCPILPGGNCAIFDYATAGPTFGSNDFCVGPPRAAIMGGFAGPDGEDMSTAAGNLRQCRSNIGTSYQNDPAWPARGSMQLVEVEVYCAARP
jgi:hypothetical protein